MSNQTGPTSPSRPTVKRLFALSGNRCAFPDCRTCLVDPATGSIVGEVCHIKGEKPSASRYDPDQDNHARHGFENLIVLCKTHHKVIDDNPKIYPVEDLLAMKERHEIQQEGKEHVDDVMSEAFTTAVIDYFIEHGSVIQAANVSGGQVAHRITNIYPVPPEDEAVRIEAKSTISAGPEFMQSLGCPGLVLTITCRSKRPAKIRRARLCLVDQGIMAAIQAGFGSDMGYTPVPGEDEELKIDLLPLQKPTTDEGFVLQQDDVARFVFPVLAGPVGLYLDRPPDASSLRVEFFDESEQVVIKGEEVRAHLEGLTELARQVQCQTKFPPVKLTVGVKSKTMADFSAMGQVNPKPIDFGRRTEETEEDE